MAVKIVTDSASDLPPMVAEELGVEIVPIRVNLGRESFRDGVDLHPREFAAKITQSMAPPTTSQPPPYEFESLFNSLIAQGNDVLCLTLSSALSGTYHSALIAANHIKGNLRVIDSQLVSAGQGLLVMRTAELAAQGESLDTLTDYAKEEKKRIRMFATLDNVEPIVRGGRLNLFARHAAGREGIKLIFSLNDSGGVQILERVRGRRRSLDRLAELITSGPLTETAIVHVDSVGEAQLVSKLIAKHSGIETKYVYEAGGTVGTYAGQGAIIVAG